MPVPDRFERLSATRIVADPAALDRLEAPEGRHLVRIAPDDLLVIPAAPSVEVADLHAIVEPEVGFSGRWFGESDLPRLQAVTGWELPRREPALAQGHIAGVPAKVLVTGGRVLVLVPAVVAHHLQERLDQADRSS